jgi:DNA repair exonuclease SbcCD ATPase subunit
MQGEITMKPRQSFLDDDGFERNVAEKMPRIRKEEERVSPFAVRPPAEPVREPLPVRPLERDLPLAEPEPAKAPEAVPSAARPETAPAEARKPPSEAPAPKVSFQSFREERAAAAEPLAGIGKLIEDLHGQLLSSDRTRRAMELDLAAARKAVHQLTQENRELRSQLSEIGEEVQRFKTLQEEAAYLEEENEDARERINALQGELKTLRDLLDQAEREREAAQARARDLEGQVDRTGIHSIRGRLMEREIAHFTEENRKLQESLKEVLDQKADLENRHETLRKSFDEVRESILLLRDSCKTSYYNLADGADGNTR